MPSGTEIKSEAEFWALFWGRVRVVGPEECWLFTGPPADTGYGQIAIPLCMNPSGKRLVRNSHRLSWEKHNGPIPDGLHVLHLCDVRLCVNPAHLYLGTQKDNVRDMVTRRRCRFGTENPLAKLTPAKVLDARTRRAAGESEGSIARSVGVSRSAIHNAIVRKTWREVGT